MGVIFYRHARVGVKVPQGRITTPKSIGFLCQNGHKREDSSQKFCSECGKPFTERFQEVFSEGWTQIATESGDSPEELYEYACQGEGELILFSSEEEQSNMDYGESLEILGYEIDHGEKLSKVNEKARKLLRYAELLGVPDACVKVYVIAYTSC